jgi:2-methylaconitate cis-trans-isomerase PrpF
MTEENPVIRLHGELIRGGTSKCWIFTEEEARATGYPDEELLLAAFNAQDARQADGIGGASSTTSKAAVVNASAEPDVDVDYTFAQVGVGQASVEWGSNCGNCATAVALWAAHHGLARVTSEHAIVRMRNTNTGARLRAVIPVTDGVVPEEGSASVPGVSGFGVPVALGFDSPVGSTTGRLLPTGRPIDLLHLADGPWSGDHGVTLVDAGAPAALVDADSLGLTGADDLRDVRTLIPELSALRREAALAMGLVSPGSPLTHSIPKVGVVGRPVDYRTSSGELVPATAYDLAVRMLSMHAPHPVIGLTSAVAVAVAALTPGTLPHRLLHSAPTNSVRLGTPAGVVPVSVDRDAAGDLTTVSLERAARRITVSTVLVPLPAPSTADLSRATLVGSGIEGQIA